MEQTNIHILPTPEGYDDYKAPKTQYCLTKNEFDEAVGCDFISYANKATKNGGYFLVGLSHGESPSGAYEYILKNYSKLKSPKRIQYTCINSKLRKQRGLVDIMDATSFLKELLRSEKISKNQIIGRSLDRNDLNKYKNGLNRLLGSYLKKLDKKGLDYIFLASDPNGLVAGITKNSIAFDSDRISVVVTDTAEPELTYTPFFIQKAKRIAFLATKSEKRRALASLFYRWGKPNETPSFLRYIDDVENKVTVFIDDQALTWPQIIIKRKTKHGISAIKLDIPKPFNKDRKKKLPVIIMVHGFLGLNTFDSLLAFMPSQKYIPAAMHYGSIPNDLPPKEYSLFVAKNIDHVVSFFGKQGHPVYIFDHSIANTYMLMINNSIEDFKGIKKYLKGRIAANPFFGQEVKHGSSNFLREIILKSNISFSDKIFFNSTSKLIPFQSRNNTRNVSIFLSNWMIKKDSKIKNRIWNSIKQRILTILVDLDTVPELNKVPIEHTLNRLPVKIFVIQIQSALRESKKLEKIRKISGYAKYEIPTLVLKSEKDPIAKFVPEIYNSTPNVEILDITNFEETDIFKEHLFYMIHPMSTIKIIENFIKENK